MKTICLVATHDAKLPNIQRIPPAIDSHGVTPYSQRVDESTVKHYDTVATELSASYESADMSATKQLLLRYLPRSGRVLEIGCGSGRDAIFLLGQGYDVQGIDASAEMIKTAQERHPELCGRIRYAPFPLSSDNPLLAERFDAVVAIAVMMHIPDPELPACAAQIGQVLSSGGIVFISTSVGREGINAGRGADGRLFLERTPDELVSVFEPAGFTRIAVHENADTFSRAVCWFSLVLQYEGVR